MRPTRRGTLAGAAVLVALAAGVVASPERVLPALRAAVGSPWFPLLLVGLYAVRPFLAWPITALSVLVGYRYGVAVGLPVALLGAVATSLLPYAAARRFGADGGLLGRVTDGATRYFETTGDFRGVVVARLVPTPAEAISAAAGFARVSVPAFAVGTVVGELPWTVGAVVAGDSMRRLAVGDPVYDPGLVALAVGSGLVLLAGPAYRAYRERAGRPG